MPHNHDAAIRPFAVHVMRRVGCDENSIFGLVCKSSSILSFLNFSTNIEVVLYNINVYRQSESIIYRSQKVAVVYRSHLFPFRTTNSQQPPEKGVVMRQTVQLVVQRCSHHVPRDALLLNLDAGVCQWMCCPVTRNGTGRRTDVRDAPLHKRPRS